MTGLSGIAVSPDIVFGKAYKYEPFVCEPAAAAYFKSGLEIQQLARFDGAVAKAQQELAALMEGFADADSDKAKIFSAHAEILCDEEITELVTEAIKERHEMPETAVFGVFQEFIALLGAAKDPLIAARAADLCDVRNRLMRILRNLPEKNLSMLPGPVIVVANDLLPSDTATIDRGNVLGVITETGGATSHMAIIASSYGIPAVLCVQGCVERIADGEELALDALAGEVWISPDAEKRAELAKKQEEFKAHMEYVNEYLSKEPQLKSGERIDIGINIGTSTGTDSFQNCDFIGLFRTEFLYMENDHTPTEDEQYAAYRAVIEKAAGKPVTLRTLDIGGDKTLSYIELACEDNPFLGNRALRLCFHNPGLFKTQLRAALRASVHGELWIMLPMVGSIDDIRKAKAFYMEVRRELESESVETGEKTKLGIMIEVPSIAMVADIAAAEVDFASIGTNDLCQYLCAADRMNPAVTQYYQNFSPAMVRTLALVIDAFNKAGKPISVCGEMAGDPKGALLLGGLGLRKLSMDASKIAAVKAALASFDKNEVEQMAGDAQSASTQAEVLCVLKKASERKAAE